MRNACIFSVRHPGDGEIKLVSATESEFVIIDREFLMAQFEGKIKLLDCTLSEVRQLRPFFEWANLEQRYLSRTVNKITFRMGQP